MKILTSLRILYLDNIITIKKLLTHKQLRVYIGRVRHVRQARSLI